MRTVWLTGLWIAAVLANGVVLAQVTSDAFRARVNADTSGANGPAANPVNRWRYRFHNGQWWFYDRGKQWSYWDGVAWRAYNRQTYAPTFDSQLPPRGYDNSYGSNSYGGGRYGFGVRAPGSIQWEKNDPKGEALPPLLVRPPGTIQRQKNELRGEYLESPDIRPPGTIQREKNSPRG